MVACHNHVLNLALVVQLQSVFFVGVEVVVGM